MSKNFSLLSCLFGMLLFCGVSASAKNAVMMTQSDNTEIVFLLSAQPKVSMQGTDVVVETAKETVTCPVADGVSFKFVDYDDASVKGLEADNVAFKVSQTAIEGFNLKPNSSVAILDLAGKTLKASSTDGAGYVNLNISDLIPGVYLFNSVDKNFKFYKK